MTDTNVPATSVTADAGRRTQATNGSCQNRQRGRGRGGQGHTPTRETAKETSNFKGNTAGMKGHVFQVFSKLSDPKEFERTIEVMGEYTAKTCKRAADVVGLFKSFEVPEIPPQKVFNRVNKTSTLAYAIWDKGSGRLCQSNGASRRQLEGHICSGMGAVLRSDEGQVEEQQQLWPNEAASNVSWLLKKIRGIVFGFDGQNYLHLSIDDAMDDFYTY